MYRKGISKLLIAGLLLSGIQLPGTTGIAQADSGKDADRLSASTGRAEAARAAGFADMKQHWASAAVNRLSAAGILQGGRGRTIQTGTSGLTGRDGRHHQPRVPLHGFRQCCIQ
ncbi:S-layer homology domain-containing protein [Paenibacillus rhizoplanae]